ncbi:MAG TPA: M56 family metallopeptidase [Methylomirabilota bacterium]|nr:M56 family metallopeptidase [Methylomirabilota bacterium]
MKPSEGMAVFWSVGIVAAYVTLIFAVSRAAQSWLRHPHWRRALWRASFLAMLLAVASELLEVRRVAQAGYERWRAAEKVGPQPESSQTAVRPPRPTLQFPDPSAFAEHGLPLNDAGASPHPAPAPHFGGGAWMALIWAIGTLFFVIRACCWTAALQWLLIKNARTMATHLSAKGVKVLESERIRTPLAGGCFRPFILLPTSFATKFTPQEQAVVLAHEMEHLRAKDPQWLLLVELTRAMLWWHPLVWVARRRFISAAEEAADWASCRVRGGPELLAECLVKLGREMVGSVERSLPAFGAGFRSGLGSRVERLLSAQRHQLDPARGPLRFLAFVAPCLGVAALVTTGATLAPAESTRVGLIKTAANWRLAFSGDEQTSTFIQTPTQRNAQRPGATVLVSEAGAAGGPARTLVVPSTNQLREFDAKSVIPIGKSAEEYHDNPELARADGVKMLGPQPSDYRANNQLQRQEGVVLVAQAKPISEEKKAASQGKSFYELNPELARRYGMVPRDTDSPTAAATPQADHQSFLEKNPLLAERYGLARANTNQGVSPEVAARYGLDLGGAKPTLTAPEPAAAPPSPSRHVTAAFTISGRELFEGIQNTMGIKLPASNPPIGLPIEIFKPLEDARQELRELEQQQANGTDRTKEIAEARKRVQQRERALSDATRQSIPPDQLAELAQRRNGVLLQFLVKLGISTNAPSAIFYNDRTEKLFIRLAPEDLSAMTEALKTFGWEEPPPANGSAK